MTPIEAVIKNNKTLAKYNISSDNIKYLKHDGAMCPRNHMDNSADSDRIYQKFKPYHQYTLYDPDARHYTFALVHLEDL